MAAGAARQAPPKAVEQVRRLVEQDEVDAVVNQVGTATASSVRKYLNTQGVPQFFVQSMSPDNYNLFRKIQLQRFDGKRWVPVGMPVGE